MILTDINNRRTSSFTRTYHNHEKILEAVRSQKCACPQTKQSKAHRQAAVELVKYIQGWNIWDKIGPDSLGLLSVMSLRTERDILSIFINYIFLYFQHGMIQRYVYMIIENILHVCTEDGFLLGPPPQIFNLMLVVWKTNIHVALFIEMCW